MKGTDWAEALPVRRRRAAPRPPARATAATWSTGSPGTPTASARSSRTTASSTSSRCTARPRSCGSPSGRWAGRTGRTARAYEKWSPRNFVTALQDADARRPRRARLPGAGRAGPRDVHRAAAAGRARAPRHVPRREPLGAEARELGAMVRGGDRLARPLDEGGRAGAVAAEGSVRARSTAAGIEYDDEGERPRAAALPRVPARPLDVGRAGARPRRLVPRRAASTRAASAAATRRRARSRWSASPTTARALLDHLGIETRGRRRLLDGRLRRVRLRAPPPAAARRPLPAGHEGRRPTPTRRGRTARRSPRACSTRAPPPRPRRSCRSSSARRRTASGPTSSPAAARGHPGDRAGRRSPPRSPASARARTRGRRSPPIRVPALVRRRRGGRAHAARGGGGDGRGIPGARLVRVPRAGHLANLEAPDAVNAALAASSTGCWAAGSSPRSVRGDRPQARRCERHGKDGTPLRPIQFPTLRRMPGPNRGRHPVDSEMKPPARGGAARRDPGARPASSVGGGCGKSEFEGGGDLRAQQGRAQARGRRPARHRRPPRTGRADAAEGRRRHLDRRRAGARPDHRAAPVRARRRALPRYA